MVNRRNQERRAAAAAALVQRQIHRRAANEGKRAREKQADRERWEAAADLVDRKAALVEALNNAGVPIKNVMIAIDSIVQAFHSTNTSIDDVVVTAIVAAIDAAALTSLDALGAALAAVNGVIPDEVASEIITAFEDKDQDAKDEADHVP